MSLFNCSLGAVDITPSQSIVLSGNGYPNKLIDDFTSKIEISIIKFVFDRELYIISADLLSIGADLRNVAKSALHEVPEENILFVASHNHNAPATDSQLPVLGSVCPIYFSYVENQLRILLSDLSKENTRKYRLDLAIGCYSESVYRRRSVRQFKYPYKAMKMLPDETVSIPHDLNVVLLRDADNKIKAVLWNWACHPTCYPDKLKGSAEFPGYVREKIRKRYGQIPIVYLQGFTGDIRPKLYESGLSIKNIIKRIIYGKSFGRVSESDWMKWADGLANNVLKCCESTARVNTLSPISIQCHRKSHELSTVQTLDVEGRVITTQVVQFAENFRIFALSCEPVSGIGELVDSIVSDSLNVWKVGYIDHTYGYLPIEKQLKEKGYEDFGFRSNFSLPGSYYQDLNKRVLKLIKQSGL